MKWRVPDQEVDQRKKTWKEVAQKDCSTHKLNRQDAVDHSRWRKQIKDD